VTLRDSRNSNLCDRETQENAHMSEVGGGGRKDSVRLINDNLKQSKGGGKS